MSKDPAPGSPRRSAESEHRMSSLEVGWEDRSWEPGQPVSMSRRQQRQSQGPYRAAIPAFVAELDVHLPSWVETEATEASLAITRFDAEVSHVLNSDPDAEIAPLVAVLLRTEAASSSEIENVTAGAKALALATIGEKSGPNASLVAENVAAMRIAMGMTATVDKGSLLAMHTALMRQSHPDIAGRIRAQQVWIGGGDDSPHLATFVPPHHERVEAALDDLTAFCDRDDVPPLTQATIAHAQFETIHPFVDGNGRVGRALVHAMLRRSGVTRRMTVPVSAGLLTDTDGYFAAFTAYRAGDAAPIVSEFSRAAHAAVANGHTLVAELVAVRGTWARRISVRRDAAAWKALDLVIRQPAVTVAVVQDATGVSQPAAQTAVDELVRAEVLVPHNAYRRNRVWVCPDVLSALDAFAQRAGRRLVRPG